MPFTFKKLDIPEVILIEPKFFEDDRGYFMETFKESEFIENGITSKFVQDNFSHSIKGTIRGLHFQTNPKAQAKLVSVCLGEIFDVAVDIRKGSPTFGKWVAEILSNENRKMLYIPEGFAHGFGVLSEIANVNYKVNQEYSPQNEEGIIWNDTDLKITWPIQSPIISSKDLDLSAFRDIEDHFDY
jgi:dTDP-4-dehydrorhamnose 3,5-epimerase